MSDPVAYFLTWTTYGTWLHGDNRRWVDRHHNRVGETIRKGSGLRKDSAKAGMKHSPVRLNEQQRVCVEQTIARVCEFKRWFLHVVNCRSNHVHVVVTAHDVPPERVMNTLKSWCSRELNDEFGKQEKRWTRHGSTRYLNDDDSLEAAVVYVKECQ